MGVEILSRAAEGTPQKPCRGTKQSARERSLSSNVSMRRQMLKRKSVTAPDFRGLRPGWSEILSSVEMAGRSRTALETVTKLLGLFLCILMLVASFGIVS